MKQWTKLAIAGVSGALSILAIFAAQKFVYNTHEFKDCSRCRKCIGDGAMLALQVHLADDHNLGYEAALNRTNEIHAHYKRRHQA